MNAVRIQPSTSMTVAHALVDATARPKRRAAMGKKAVTLLTPPLNDEKRRLAKEHLDQELFEWHLMGFGAGG